MSSIARRTGRFFLVLLFLCVDLVPATAVVHFGVAVGAGFGYASGPYWPGCYYCTPFWGGWGYPYWAPFYGPGYFMPAPDKGEVKLESSYKDAEVYLDDAYAGTTAKLKSFWLAPGVYNLEVRPAGVAPVSKRIYVLTGKTLRLRFD